MADPDGLDDHPHLSGAWLRVSIPANPTTCSG
jgi:hypothetical protein